MYLLSTRWFGKLRWVEMGWDGLRWVEVGWVFVDVGGRPGFEQLSKWIESEGALMKPGNYPAKGLPAIPLEEDFLPRPEEGATSNIPLSDKKQEWERFVNELKLGKFLFYFATWPHH